MRTRDTTNRIGLGSAVIVGSVGLVAGNIIVGPELGLGACAALVERHLR